MSEQDATAVETRKKVIIVDDHPIIRQGLRAVIDQQPDMVVCGEAWSVSQALQVMDRTPPDLAIVDLSLKDSNGLDLIKDIAIRWPSVQVLVLSMRDEAFYAERVLRAGARGYVTKDEGPQKVVDALRKVIRGEIHLSDQMASKILRKFAGGGSTTSASLVDTLTDRELQILHLIGSGLPTREIAERLHISTKTVDSHREHIKEKLRLESATELLKHAIQWVQCQKGG
jgi:DNA-binding NarL/FixJ family response regulator